LILSLGTGSNKGLLAQSSSIVLGKINKVITLTFYFIEYDDFVNKEESPYKPDCTTFLKFFPELVDV
jgi:hypothetical protein